MFATIYLPNFYLQAATRHQPELRAKPVGLIEEQQRKPVIVQLNEPAEKAGIRKGMTPRSEEHTSELQSQSNLVCRLLLEKKKFNWIVSGMEAPVNIALNFALIPPYGMMGARLSTAAAYLALFLGMTVNTQPVHPVAYQRR